MHCTDSLIRRCANFAMSALATLLIHVFFRSVEVEDPDRFPASGPVLVVTNHLNGLVDGLLLMATMRRYPRFLGKSGLFRILPLVPFLKLAGVIRVHRVMDGGTVDNASAFLTSAEILAQGGVVAVFPEGISHDEPSLQPLRTGAARIALEANAAGVPNVQILAVGLTYDAKSRFRSRALVRIAVPETIDGWANAYQRDSRETVRRLTADLADNLASVSPTFQSWAQAESLARVAEVIVRTQPEALPGDADLSDVVEVTELLAETEAAAGDDPSLVAFRRAAENYERDLALLGLTDAQVVAGYQRRRLRWAVSWSLLKVLAAVPPAVVGVVAHLMPYEIIKAIAKRPTNEGMKATVKLIGCAASFALVYTALGYLIAQEFGIWIGLLVAVAMPLCGYVTVRLAERLARVGSLVQGYRTVRERRGVFDTVLFHRAKVVQSACELLGQHQGLRT